MGEVPRRTLIIPSEALNACARQSNERLQEVRLEVYRGRKQGG